MHLTADHPTSNPAPAAPGSQPAADSTTAVRRWLRANATFSTLSGVAVAAAAPWLADQLGTDATALVRLVGVALVVYGVDLAVLATRSAPLVRRLTPAVVVADVVWVAVSAAALAAGAVATTVGTLLVADVAAIVAVFAIGQYRALRNVAPPA